MPKLIPFLRQLAFDRQHGLCFYCSVRMWNASPAELPNPAPSTRAANRLRCTAEHLKARSDGGADVPTNIAAACAHCNGTRHKRRTPPRPEMFAKEVRKRVAARAWHHRWVYERGLL
jgi:5-methylcytosine-specific restriction endonuclease McrA